jgi:DNA polymerase-1
MSSPHVLIIDGQNFLYRARSGFQLGDFAIVFNFMRNFRAQVELHNPTQVYFILEGHPKKRIEMFPEYKANRKVDVDSTDPEIIKKIAEQKNFFRQADIIVDMLSRYFPVSIIRHQDFECDDVIYNLIKRSTSDANFTVVSNDSDFTQLLNEFDNVKVYNPMLKTYFVKTEFDYVSWKSLRGDGSDNIPGIPGIGDKTADSLINDADAMSVLFENKDTATLFLKNYELIKFHTWSDEEASQITRSNPEKNWLCVSELFNEWAFKSLLKENAWNKFIDTFNVLWDDI